MDILLSRIVSHYPKNNFQHIDMGVQFDNKQDNKKVYRTCWLGKTMFNFTKTNIYNSTEVFYSIDDS